MKTSSPALRTHLDGESTTITTCWEITRTDGVQFFFTEHDRQLEVNGDIYKPDSAYSRSAISNKEDLSVDNLDIAGAVSDDSITDQDLRNGLFDHAEVRLFLVNWKDISQGTLSQRRGRLGEVRLTEVGFFFAELRGLTQQLSETRIVELSTPECRADLGDVRCKVPIEPPVWASAVDYETDRFPAGQVSLKGPNEFRVAGSVLVSDWVRPTVRNDRIFRVSVAGRSNPVEPTWDTTLTNTTTQPWASFTAWTATEVLAVGDVRRATVTPTDRLFVVTVAGTTGGTEPSWNTTVDDLTADGSVTWQTYPLPPEWITEDAFNKEGTVNGLTPFTPTKRVFQVKLGDIVAPTKFYNFGVLEWTSGLNLGRRHEVRDWINAVGVYVENASPNLDFLQGAGDDTAVRDAGSWLDDGFVPGQSMIVTGSPSQNGTYLVNGVTDLVLTISGDWPAQDVDTTGASLTGLSRQVTLFLPAVFDLSEGDTFLMYPGCQKRQLLDCRDVFDNVVNFRGEAYLPGNDSRFSYPNARA